MRIAGRVALLVALWLLAWGEASIANVASGIAVAAALLVAFPPGRRSGAHIQAAGAARLSAYVVRQLLKSNVVMAREIARRHPRFEPGVLAHRLRRPSDEAITVMTSVIALSPGTMTVDVDRASSTIFVHFLFLDDVDQARRSLEHLEQLAVAAITAPQPVDRNASWGKDSE